MVWLRTLSLAVGATVALSTANIARPLVARSADVLCDAPVTVLPWADERDSPIAGQSSDRYGVYVFARAKENITATIALASDTDLYVVAIRDGKIFPEKDDPDGAGTALLVRFKSPVAIRYAYVAELGSDDAPAQRCLAKATSTDNRTAAQMSARLGSLVPTRWADAVSHRAPSCASAYTEAAVLGIPDEDTETADYGNTPRSALVDVVVAADGSVLKTNINQTSGVDAIDAQAIKTANDARYKPASLLCAPVVSEYLFKYEYAPH
jgi:hypothetical protein